MSAPNSSSVLRAEPKVVGTVHSPGALRQALQLRPGEVDLLEIRVDSFAQDFASLLAALPDLPAPLIVTARHPAEGGTGALSAARRAELFTQFLPFAAWIDLELQSAEELAGTLAAARQRGVKIIASSHYFSDTPSPQKLAQTAAAAHLLGADVCKIATLVSTPSELATLLNFLTHPQPLPLSVMGMGPLGKISRLLLATCGSRLNYGYLDVPNAAGQWEAGVLKQRLAELVEQSAS